MKAALEHLATVSTGLDDDPLYAWIAGSHHDDARRHYDAFLPIIDFILAFPSYNDTFLAYPRDGGEHAVLRRVINEHVAEDRTHARLFLQDVRTIGLAEVWGLTRASTVLWCLWLSPMLEPARVILHDRLRSLVADQGPPLRYLHIEQLEQDGHRLFTAAAAQAVEIHRRTGVRPVYFGPFHLDRESGHVGGTEFEEVVLTPEQAIRARQIVADKHAASVGMNAVMHRFALGAQDVERAGILLEQERTDSLRRTSRRLAEHRAGTRTAATWRLEPDDLGDTGLAEAWSRHHDDVVRHPFATLLRRAHGPEALYALRCASLLFAARICSLHAFYLFDCRPEQDGPGAEAVRAVGTRLAAQTELFLADWHALGMDARIPWDLPGLLDWMFFDPTYGQPETVALHVIRRETLRHADDPAVLLWAMLAVQMMARAFFGATVAAAERVADEHPGLPPLPYLAGLHHLHVEDLPPLPPDLPVPETDEQRRAIRQLMDVVAEVGTGQFDNQARALTTDRARFAFLEEA